MEKYFSSLSGEDIDHAIEVLQNMRPQIVVTGATANSSVNCKCTAVNYNQTKTADSTGTCTFYIPEYGDYIINDSVTQPMYEYKKVIITL